MNETLFHHNYALIDENNIIQDIIYCISDSVAAIIANNTYPNGKAVCIDTYPVKISDMYINRKFFRKTEDNYYKEIVPIPTEIETTSNLNIVIQKLKMQIEFLEKVIKEHDISL